MKDRRICLTLTLLLAFNCPSFGDFCCFAAKAEGIKNANYEILCDVTYATPGEKPLKADVYRPQGTGPFPGVLCIHGGAWARGNKYQMGIVARQLAENGYTAVSIEYRLAPRYKFPTQLDDCRAAFRWMSEFAVKYKIDKNRLAAWGYSSGGHLATLLGVASTDKLRPKAIVACAAPFDFVCIHPDNVALVYWLGATRRVATDVYREASPLQFVSPNSPPTFICNGGKDWFVQIGQSHAMMRRLMAAKVPVEMCSVENAGHLAIFLDHGIRTKAIRFLDRHLGKTPKRTSSGTK